MFIPNKTRCIEHYIKFLNDTIYILNDTMLANDYTKFVEI